MSNLSIGSEVWYVAKGLAIRCLIVKAEGRLYWIDEPISKPLTEDDLCENEYNAKLCLCEDILRGVNCCPSLEDFRNFESGYLPKIYGKDWFNKHNVFETYVLKEIFKEKASKAEFEKSSRVYSEAGSHVANKQEVIEKIKKKRIIKPKQIENSIKSNEDIKISFCQKRGLCVKCGEAGFPKCQKCVKNEIL